ncbi:MAG TPA: LapA family protein [Thermoplasmata archaeon]|nr:LapA family protein [Thermoplasmata archaeon]
MGLAGIAAGIPAAVPSVARAVVGDTDLQQTTPLIWVMLVVSVIGAILTWAFLAYAIWKYRDPATKGRRYG